MSSNDDDEIEVLEHRKGVEPKIVGPTGYLLTIKPAAFHGLGYFRLLFFIQAFILFRTALNFIPCMVTQPFVYLYHPPATPPIPSLGNGGWVKRSSLNYV